MGRRLLTGLIVTAAALLLSGLAQGRGSQAVAPTSLPSMSRFDGQHSINDTVLSRLLHQTIGPLGKAAPVNVACWDDRDWASIADRTGAARDAQGSFIAGLFVPSMPDWINLAPATCKNVQALIDSGKPNPAQAAALTAVIHEAVHANGIRDEAQTNCVAVQLVPLFARALGYNRTRTIGLSRLALDVVREHAGAGSWDASRCQDGGVWDLDPVDPNLSL
jgi:hypothetical protein